uniref:RNase H type-1 domain-containing protein n=1 Tax=Brassica oleracea TaxID=3712 RepID=A0A3P6EDW3_BRAOL|nr:unnamed protein product [Brassica oleracea]
MGELNEPSDVVAVRSDAVLCSTRQTAELGLTIGSAMQNRSFQQRIEFVGSPLMAEWLTLREVVLTCQRLELWSVRFESDSTQLVKCINSVLEVAELHSISSDVLAIVAEFVRVSFVWIPREKNMIADCLAKNALIVVELAVVEDVVNAPN